MELCCASASSGGTKFFDSCGRPSASVEEKCSHAAISNGISGNANVILIFSDADPSAGEQEE